MGADFDLFYSRVGVLRVDLTFKTATFEGPLDLLEHLIKKNKLNICSVSLIAITDQYIEYINGMKEKDLDISSEFLVVASNLLYIKSKALLPKHEEEDDAEQIARDLTEALKKRHTMKLISELFKKKQFDGALNFYKEAEILDIAPVKREVEQVELDRLMAAFLTVIEKTERKAPPPKSNFEGVVGREKVSVREKAGNLMEKVRASKKISFSNAFKGIKTRGEAVALFLAILELLKTNSLVAYDEGDEVYFKQGKSKNDTLSGEFDG